MTPEWLEKEVSVELEERKYETCYLNSSNFIPRESSYSIGEIFERAEEVYERLCAVENSDFGRSVTVENVGSRSTLRNYDEAERIVEESNGRIVSFNYWHPEKDLDFSMTPEDGRMLIYDRRKEEEKERFPQILSIPQHKLSLEISPSMGSQMNQDLFRYEKALQHLGFEII